jgi:uncharacterized protein YcbX
MDRVATVAAIGRYPVKSMRGEALDEAVVGWNGLLGDRRYAFVRTDTRSYFPWLTGRQTPDLIRYTPRFEREPAFDAPDQPVRVTTPDGERHAIDDPALRSRLEAEYGHPLYLLNQNRGCFDGAHISLFGLPTVRRLGEEVGRPLERERFRANFYLQPEQDAPFIEDEWVGRTLAIGDTVRLAVTQRDKRCVMTTLDPATAEATPAVLRTIVERHGQCAGVYASVIATGVVRLGDPVRLIG